MSHHDLLIKLMEVYKKSRDKGIELRIYDGNFRFKKKGEIGEEGRKILDEYKGKIEEEKVEVLEVRFFPRLLRLKLRREWEEDFFTGIEGIVKNVVIGEQVEYEMEYRWKIG